MMDYLMLNYNSKILSDAEEYTGNNLKSKNEIELLLNECKTKDDFLAFEELCFTGKYVSGMIRVLKSAGGNPEVENTDKIKKDLSDNMEKVISLLKKITLNSSEEIKNAFNEKYFQLTASTLNNLYILTSDLDTLKKYINYLKRSSVNEG